MAEEVATFDEDTHTFVEQVHAAWSSNAPISTYANIRDEILAQQEQIETRVATLSTVAVLAYPEEVRNDNGETSPLEPVGPSRPMAEMPKGVRNSITKTTNSATWLSLRRSGLLASLSTTDGIPLLRVR
jgi:hypothetical protein